MKKFWKKILKFFKKHHKKPAPKPDDPVIPETPDTPPSSPQDIVTVPVTVGLPNGMVYWSNLVQEAKILTCSFDGGTLKLTWEYLVPWSGVGDEFCDGTVCFFAKDRAAYVDYKPIGNGYSWPSIGQHLHDGHGDLNLTSGDAIGFFISGTINPSQRSDIFWTTIP